MSSDILQNPLNPAAPEGPAGRASVLFLVVFDFGEFGIDDVLVSLAVASIVGAGGRGRLLFLLVNRLAELHRDLRERLRLFGHRGGIAAFDRGLRSEEHTSELQSLMRISYAVFCLKKKNQPASRT